MSHVGVNLGFGNLHENLTDAQMYAGEVRIAELADQLGFDSLWVVDERSARAAHAFFLSNVRHYELGGEHFAQTKGYEQYAEAATLLRQAGLEAVADRAGAGALYGTPDEVLRKIAVIRDVLGDFSLMVIPSFGGLPYDQAAESLELFAKEVMPGVRELQG